MRTKEPNKLTDVWANQKNMGSNPPLPKTQWHTEILDDSMDIKHAHTHTK